MSAMPSETVAEYAAAPRSGGLGEMIARLRADRAFLRRVLMIGGIAIVAAVSAALWLTGGRYVSTDDSYVHAAQLPVSTDVSGLVKDVDVREGQIVKKGDVLFRIDPLQFQIALDNAKANLNNERLTLLAQKDAYASTLKNIAAQAAQVQLDQVTADRYAQLMKQSAIAPNTYDQARFTLATAQAQLAALKDQAAQQLAALGGNINLPVESLPPYRAALAQVDEQQRQLSHSVVRAPFDGMVTAVDSLQPGTLVVSALSAFSTTSAVLLVSTKDVWVEADMKETDLTHVHVGDPVEVTIDTYPGHTWHGSVDSISPATGSDFSVLPAENASGNWVKVTQRVTVRVKLEQHPHDPPLRAGLSAYVSIDTGHRRWWRLLNG